MKLLAATLLILLCGCTERQAETPRESGRDPSVFDPMISTIDRAQGVEQTLQDSAAERRRQLEAAEGR